MSSLSIHAAFRLDSDAIYSFSIAYKASFCQIPHNPCQMCLKGAWFPSNLEKNTSPTKEITMAPMKRYAKRQAKAITRRRLKAQQRLRQQRAQGQRSIEAIHQALEDLAFPETLVAEIEGRLRAQQTLLGTIVGLMFPTFFGCRHGHELTRVRGWDKPVPSKRLGALPKRSWLKRRRRLGREMLLSIWRHTQNQSASTQSRW
jgi:hypothetical protein